MTLSRRGKITLGVLVVLLALTALCVIYLAGGYDADLAAIAAFAPELDPAQTVFGPADAKVGFIFYPGGKVDHRAYAPLMAEIAERGILCILAPMPADLAVFDIFADMDILEAYPEIEQWYIGGHSLGGSMAAIAVENWTVSPYDGIVLLAAYSTLELPSAMKALSIYGSEDGVLNREKYAEYRPNIAEDLIERVLDGGNHAGFAMYGPQKGDGEATLSTEAQIELTADAVAAFILAE